MTFVQIFMVVYAIMTHVSIVAGNMAAARTFLFANLFLLSSEAIGIMARLPS